MKLTHEQIDEFLFTKYDIEALSIQQLAPVFRIETKLGPLCLKRVTYSENKLYFICLAMSHLTKKGFSKSPEILPTRRGKLYTHFANGLCFLTDWVADTPCDFEQRSHLFSATTTLAEFHQYARDLRVPHQLLRRSFWERWPKVLARRTQDLLKYKAIVEEGDSSELVKRTFLSLFDEQVRQAKESLDILQSSQYDTIAKTAETLKTFVHRDVAARNFVLDYYGTARMIDFDYCRWDIHVADIVRLLDRSLKSHKWHFGLAQRILSVYDEITPINPEEYPALLALLHFPQKFWRLCHRYFEGSSTLSKIDFLSGLRDLEQDLTQKSRFIHRFKQEYCLGFTIRFYPSNPIAIKSVPATEKNMHGSPSRIGLKYQQELYQQAYLTQKELLS